MKRRRRQTSTSKGKKPGTEPSKGDKPYQYLNIGLLFSRTVRK
jgi:hypothetical protein